MEVRLHSYLTSELNWDERAAPYPGGFTLVGIFHGPNHTGVRVEGETVRTLRTAEEPRSSAVSRSNFKVPVDRHGNVSVPVNRLGNMSVPADRPTSEFLSINTDIWRNATHFATAALSQVLPWESDVKLLPY